MSDSKEHVWDEKRDVCLRCARTAKQIFDFKLKCEWT
jgi:hypothetical protein